MLIEVCVLGIYIILFINHQVEIVAGGHVMMIVAALCLFLACPIESTYFWFPFFQRMDHGAIPLSFHATYVLVFAQFIGFRI